MALRTSRLACRRIAGLALLLVGVLFITGCDTEAYSDDMKYPLRTDPIVIKAPDTQPYTVDPPGALNQLPERIKKLEGKILDPKDLVGKKSKERGQLEKRLEEIFGTPAHPKVDGKLGDSEEEIADAPVLKLKDENGKDMLAAGSKLFRRHCLHCHGLTGDGHGPTAEWVNPHPRDYRPGIFKFTSSSQQAGTRKPRREDLKRTLRSGIEGTSMPSFGLLSDSELEELVSYVIHLSLRGEVESVVIQKLVNDDNLEGDSVAEETDKQVGRLAKYWLEAQGVKSLIKPEAYAGMSEGSVKNGYRLFLDQTAAGCVSCHKDFGRQNNYKWDAWGTIVRPLDFTSGVYRGGRRPLDFYWRIHSGINGSGMSAFYEALKPTDDNMKLFADPDQSVLDRKEKLLKFVGEFEPIRLLSKEESAFQKEFKGGTTEEQSAFDEAMKSLKGRFALYRSLGKEVERLNLSAKEKVAVKKGFQGATPAETAEFEGMLKAMETGVANERIWDLVDLLQVLPYPEMRRKYGIDID